MHTLQRELRTTFIEILKKYGIANLACESIADELATTAKEFHYSPHKKGDLIDGIIHYAGLAEERGEDKVEEVLNDLERSLHRNIQRSGQWQDLARWMLRRNDTEPYKKWMEWYMSDPFQAKTSWRLTPDQVRACWPGAFTEPEVVYQPYTAEQGKVYVKLEPRKVKHAEPY